eukprot:9352302-Pyramimonas_sp.AAC.1
MRNSKKRKVTIRDVAMLYGLRPKRDGLWHLSPCEFVTYWRPVLVAYPTSVDAQADRDRHHAFLTPEGEQEMKEWGRNQEQAEDFVPGVDYMVKGDAGKDWVVSRR